MDINNVELMTVVKGNWTFY